jgi:hypothetical protein
MGTGVHYWVKSGWVPIGHSPPSSAEITNERSFTSFSSYMTSCRVDALYFYSPLPYFIFTFLHYSVCILSASLCVIRTPKLKFAVGQKNVLNRVWAYFVFWRCVVRISTGLSAILRDLLCISTLLPNKSRHISLNRPRPLRPISSPFPHSDGPILCPSSSTKCLKQDLQTRQNGGQFRIATTIDCLCDYGIPFFPRPSFFQAGVRGEGRR